MTIRPEEAMREGLQAERDRLVLERKRLEVEAITAREAIVAAKRRAGGYVPEPEWSRLVAAQRATESHRVHCAVLDQQIAALNGQIRTLARQEDQARGKHSGRNASWHFLNVARRRLPADLFTALLEEALAARAAAANGAAAAGEDDDP